MAADNKLRLHLPDGAAQRAREAQPVSGATDIFFSAWDWLYLLTRQPLVRRGPDHRAESQP
jgi:hypothetical protein